MESEKTKMGKEDKISKLKKTEQEERETHMYWQGFGGGYNQAIRDIENELLPALKRNRHKYF